MLFLAAAELVGTAVGQLHVDVQPQRVKGRVVLGLHIGLNVFQVMPPTRLTVPVKYLSMTSLEMPTASKIWLLW